MLTEVLVVLIDAEALADNEDHDDRFSDIDDDEIVSEDSYDD